jgi:hypothetical protein
MSLVAMGIKKVNSTRLLLCCWLFILPSYKFKSKICFSENVANFTKYIKQLMDNFFHILNI